MDELERRIDKLEERVVDIGHRLALVESEQGTILRQRERIDKSIKDVDDKYQKIIYGHDDKIGMKIQIDRMEQIMYKWAFVVGVSGSVISGLIVYLITR